jgi:putative ABC transport system permease protein
MRVFAAISEATWDLLAQPRRLIGAGLATALGIGLFVAAGTLNTTASQQISAAFDVYRATEVRVIQSHSGTETDWIPGDYLDRLQRLAGVTTAQMIADLDQGVISSSPPGRPDLGTSVAAHIWGVDEGGPRALGAVIDGSQFGQPYGDVPTVLLGSRLAADLDINTIDGIQAVWLNGNPAIVRGIIRSLGRRTEILDGAMVLTNDSNSLGLHAIADEIIIETVGGAAQSIAEEAPLALRPDNPTLASAIAPPDASQFRQTFESSIRQALLAISGVAILVGALVIGSSIAGSVLARTAEMGLRRALGARSTDLLAIIAAEGTIVGFFGGTAGASLGLVGAIAVSSHLGWKPIVDPLAPLLGVGVSTLIGLLASSVAGIRAARIDPAAALRS